MPPDGGSASADSAVAPSDDGRKMGKYQAIDPMREVPPGPSPGPNVVAAAGSKPSPVTPRSRTRTEHLP